MNKSKIFTLIILLLTMLFLSYGCEKEEMVTVTFDSNGGTIVSSQTIVKNANAVKPTDPEKTNSVFCGWYFNDELWSFNGYVVSKDITLVAKWEDITYTVSFEVDDTIYDTKKCVKGEKTTKPNDPIKDGFTFLGWYLDKEEWSFIGYVVTSDITLKARWSKIEEIDKVEIIGYNKILNDKYCYTVNNDVSTFNFTKYINTYCEWDLTSDITGKDKIITKQGSLQYGNNDYYVLVNIKGTIVTYQFSIYRLSLFEVSFISSTGKEIKKMNIIENDLITNIPTEEIKGYTFEEWDYDFNNKVTSDLVITGKYVKNKYTIAYELFEGENAEENILVYDVETVFNLKNPLKKDHLFMGWFLDNEYKEQITDIKEGSTGDLILYAKWLKTSDIGVNSFTDYDKCEGNKYYYTVSNDTSIFDFQEYIEMKYEWQVRSDITLGNNIVSKQGSLALGVNDYYIFVNINGDNVTFIFEIYRLSLYTVRFVTSLGNQFTVKNVTEGELITDIKYPEIVGYTFDNWSYDFNTKVTKDLTVVAKYNKIIYTITYELFSGVNNVSNPYEYNVESEKLLYSPTKDNYTFKGWFLDPDYQESIEYIEKGTTGDLVLYAKWQLIKITYGMYPNTLEINLVTINALDLIDTPNSKGYYEYNGNEYAKVVAKPYDSEYTFGNGRTVYSDDTYYFKVEPITWIVLSETKDEYFVMSLMALESMEYQTSCYSEARRYYTNANGAPEGTYANNYEYSDIRKWLNNNFLNTAFTEDEKMLIKETTVDNSSETTYTAFNEFYCNDTNDYVFLLSYEEAENMIPSEYTICSPTDYTLAKGIEAKEYTYEVISTYWWLRSSSSQNSDCVAVGTPSDVLLDFGSLINWDEIGCRPAMIIKKNN